MSRLFGNAPLRRLASTLALTFLASVSAAAQTIPVRAVGVNEGFADLLGSAPQATTVTAADIASTTKTNRNFKVVKIWPLHQTPVQLAPVFNDPNIKIIVYRPLHLATSQVLCNSGPGYFYENVDYGTIATRLYQLYPNVDKTVILTGWEADNQINYWPPGSPSCGWPASQAVIDDYKAMLQKRQNDIAAARAANPTTLLKVYHAVELKQVPDFPGGTKTVLDQIVRTMNPKPDFISYSAWGATPAKLPTKLTNISSVSTLPANRIYVGEWGCTENDPNRAGCYQNHAAAAFNWGVRLWIPWAYSSAGGGNSYDLVDGQTHLDTANGFNILRGIDSTYYQAF